MDKRIFVEKRLIFRSSQRVWLEAPAQLGTVKLEKYSYCASI